MDGKGKITGKSRDGEGNKAQESHRATDIKRIKDGSMRKSHKLKTKTKLHGLSPRANYTDRATAACQRSDCQLLRI
jgi:hypothetical protein